MDREKERSTSVFAHTYDRPPIARRSRSRERNRERGIKEKFLPPSYDGGRRGGGDIARLVGSLELRGSRRDWRLAPRSRAANFGAQGGRRNPVRARGSDRGRVVHPPPSWSNGGGDDRAGGKEEKRKENTRQDAPTWSLYNVYCAGGMWGGGYGGGNCHANGSTGLADGVVA